MLTKLKMMQDKYSSCKFSGETYVGRIAKRCSMISLVLRPDSQTPRVETLVLVKLERHWRPKTANTATKKARLTASVAFWHLIPNNYCIAMCMNDLWVKCNRHDKVMTTNTAFHGISVLLRRCQRDHRLMSSSHCSLPDHADWTFSVPFSRVLKRLHMVISMICNCWFCWAKWDRKLQSPNASQYFSQALLY